MVLSDPYRPLETAGHDGQLPTSLAVRIALLAVLDGMAGVFFGFHVLEAAVRGEFDVSFGWIWTLLWALLGVLALLALGAAIGLFSRRAPGWRVAVAFHFALMFAGLLVYGGLLKLIADHWGGRYGGDPATLGIVTFAFVVAELIAVVPLLLLRRQSVRQAFGQMHPVRSSSDEANESKSQITR